MNDRISFIIKILLASTFISAGIKYGGSYLAIAPTDLNAFLLVTVPPAIFGLLLLGRLPTETGQAHREP
ncbi:hypothetical protein [Oscillatoria sp. FACHB-1406]|uniref:hypothetical protein n=1 Tax=Oscillatoria sp. FACHB-1406 TaxID=2692846 RepID=UPI00168311B1|nr:hypothetical protein [Oscillatoria sp. FACHB-1406]MBD2577349.1 hypothetical protein [Oscillatoria sp. FACHB-1406]